MNKNIFFIAFLGLVGVCMTACSSGDDLEGQNNTVNPDNNNNKNNVVILTGTLSSGSGNSTRAVGTNGKTITWATGDHILVQYENTDGDFASADGTITLVDDHHATFTASMTNPKPNGKIGLAYPYSKASASTTTYNDFTFSYTNAELYNQDGTTTGITTAKLDYAKTEAEVTMDVNGGTATLHRNAVLENQTSICEFNILDTDGSTPLTATQLLIEYGTTKYTITGSRSTFYVALQPKPETTNKVKVTAILNGSVMLDAAGVAAMTSSDIGKFICSDDANYSYQGYLCTNKTTAAKANIHTYAATTTFAKGKFYTLNLQARALTPVAVVGYAANSTSPASNYFSKFVAIALEDISTSGVTDIEGAQSAANTWVGNHKVKIGSTECFTLYSSNYDVVTDNAGADDSLQPADDSGWESSASRTTDANQGWRIPSVTDFRYIFEGLSNVSATNPKGIVDQACHYPTSSPQHESTCYSYIYASNKTIDLKKAINDACGNTDLHAQFYWTSSAHTGDASTKGWRYHFEGNQWHFNSISEMSLLRAVLAY